MDAGEAFASDFDDVEDDDESPLEEEDDDDVPASDDFFSLLRESVQLSMAAVPSGVDADAVRAFLCAQPGVKEVHDLHIWALSTTENALTAHVVMPGGYPGDRVLDAMVAQLRSDFGIHHCTLQVEEGTTHHDCVLDAQGHDHDGHDHAHHPHEHDL